MIGAAPMAFVNATRAICVEQQRNRVAFGFVIFMMPDFAGF
jgi:hypothetical protein